MTRYIALADGKQYPSSMAGENAGVLWLNVENITLLEAVKALTPEACAIIEWHYGSELVARYEGYTDIVLVKKAERGVFIALRKEMRTHGQ